MRSILCMAGVVFLTAMALAAEQSPLQPPLRALTPLPAEPDVPAVHEGYKSIPLHVTEPAGVKRVAHPIRGGVPFPKGELTDFAALRLVDEQGTQVPAQFDVLSRWWDFSGPRGESSDHSIKWLAVSFLTDLDAGATRTLRLQYGDVPRDTEAPMTRQTAQGLAVDTGVLRATFDPASGQLRQIERRFGDNWQAMLASPAELYVEMKATPPAKGGLWTNLAKLDGERQWKFLPDPDGVGEHSGWHTAKVDERAWTWQNPREPWENQGFATHDGAGWYRTHVSAPEQWRGRAVYLELSDQAWYALSEQRKFDVYLNGERVAMITPRGQVAPTDDSTWRQPRVRLPESKLRFGQDNLIVVRAHDGGDGVGGLLCNPRIVSPHDASRDGAYPDASGRYDNLRGKGGDLSVLSSGPRRAVVRVKGWLADDRGGETSRYTLFYVFHRGSALMDVSYTFTNTEDPVLVSVQSAGLTLPLAVKGAMNAMLSAEAGAPFAAPLGASGRLVLHQFHDGEARYPGWPSLAALPLKLKYEVRDAAGAVLRSGGQTIGWAGLNWDGASATVSMRDFCRSYPSEISIDGTGRLTAYMWPGDGPAMDLRMWVDRKDGGWAKMEEDAKAGSLVAQSARSLALADHGDGETISDYNAVGVAWTRNLQFNFEAAAIDGPAAQAKAVAFDQPILPFVTAQWNCRSEAIVGVPLHPYDPANFPLLENVTDAIILWNRKMLWEHNAVLGMWHLGALRYNMFRDGSEDLGYFKVNWSRRWFNQESGQSAEMTPLVQYLRTGHLPYYTFGKAMADFASNVCVRTWHRLPLRTGYTARHRYTVFGNPSPSHTNLEGVILAYCLSADDRTRDFLDQINAQYKREPIERFTVLGNWLDREHDSPLLNRLLLWDLDGEDWQREWVLRGLDFYRRNDLTGFTNQGGATYRTAQMTRMWRRTRDPAFIDLMADVPAFLLNGSTDGMFERYAKSLTYATEQSPWLAGKTLDRAQIQAMLTPDHGRSYALAGEYPGEFMAYHYAAGLPVLEHDLKAYPNLLRMHGRYGKIEPVVAGAGSRIEPVDLRGAANADPFAVVDVPNLRWQWLGQYHAYNDQSPAFDPKLAAGDIGVDFGPVENTAEGWHRGYGRALYPTYEGYECSSNFAGLPFGATVAFHGVPFELIDPATNQGRGQIRTVAGQAIEIPVNRKASRLVFLGHVLNGPDRGKAGEIGRYVVRYDDGSIQTVDLRDGLAADAWRNFGHLAAHTIPAPFVRTWNQLPLHVNLFIVQTDAAKSVTSVSLEPAVDGFCVLALSAESAGEAPATQETIVYDAAKDAPAALDQPISLALADGWYDLTVEIPKYKTSEVVYQHNDAQVYVEVQGELAVCGFMSRFGQGLTFPAQAQGGGIKLVLRANMTAPGQPVLTKVTARPRAGSPGWTAARRKVSDLYCYGFARDRMEAGSIMGEGLTDYPQRDAVTRDWANAAENTFTMHAAPGFYRVRLMLFSPLGHPGYSVKVNGRSSAAVVLANQRWAYGDERVCRSYEVLTAPVHAADGRVAIEFPMGVGNYYWNQMVGVRGLTLTPIDEATYKAELVEVADTGPKNEEWELRFSDTFDNEDFESRWKVMEGTWNVTGGMLTGRGLIFCNMPLPGAQRIEYECRSNKPCDLSAVISSDWAGIVSGYIVAFGAENNAFSRLLIRAKEVKRWDTLIEPGKLHKVVVERDGPVLRQWVDGKLVMEYTDEKPLRQPLVGLYVWTIGQFDNVRIYTKRDR